MTLIFHFDDVIIVKFSIKGDNALFVNICVLCLWEVTFFQTWICMAMIFEPYLDCYTSIFSPNLVCCSWDYGLSEKWSPILNRMSGTWSNFHIKHITLICQHDKLPLVRWYVHSSISPIDFVPLVIIIISSFFLYIFCRRDISRTESTIIFKFSQYVCQYQESTGEAFQCDHSTMTSSRRHFVFSRYQWYLHIHSSKINQIQYT